MTTAKDDKATDAKKDLTLDEFLERANDPALLRAMAAKQGLQIVDPTEKKTTKKEPATLPTVELPEDATTEDLVKALNEAFAGFANFVTSTVADSKEEVESKLTQSKEEQIKNEILRYADDKKILKDILNGGDRTKLAEIDALYRANNGNIDKAYRKYLKANDLEFDGKETTSDTTEKNDSISEPKKSKSTSVKTDSVTKNDIDKLEDVKDKNLSTKDAAAKAFDSIVAEQGDKMTSENL